MTITVQPNPETKRFYLMVEDGRMRSFPAGPRLFRAAPFPDIRFIHESHESATQDAETLQKYLNECGGRKLNKKQIREAAD